MPVAKFITLEAWLELTYGTAVSIGTGRRWCRENRITPKPEKHGRTYFVTPDARYTDVRAANRPRLVDRIKHAA